MFVRKKTALGDREFMAQWQKEDGQNAIAQRSQVVKTYEFRCRRKELVEAVERLISGNNNSWQSALVLLHYRYSKNRSRVGRLFRIHSKGSHKRFPFHYRLMRRFLRRRTPTGLTVYHSNTQNTKKRFSSIFVRKETHRGRARVYDSEAAKKKAARVLAKQAGCKDLRISLSEEYKTLFGHFCAENKINVSAWSYMLPVGFALRFFGFQFPDTSQKVAALNSRILITWNLSNVRKERFLSKTADK